MRRFFLKAAILSGTLILFGAAVSFFVDQGLRRSEHPLYKTWNDIYNSKINADVLIQGSSHARVQISPSIMDSMLRLNTYNIGIDGYPFDMQYARFKIYLEHNKQPKYVIQNIDAETLEKSETPFMSDQFLPYLGDPLLRKVLMNNTILPWYYFYFYFYKYVEHFELAKTGISEYLGFKKSQSETYKGYEPMVEKWNHDFEDFKAGNKTMKAVMDTTVMAMFDEFLRDCKKRNIEVILVACPQYYEFTKLIEGRNQLTDVYKAFSKKYNVPVLDYTNDSLCYDVKYFRNPTHLNKEGSELFSVKLANDVKGL